MPRQGRRDAYVLLVIDVQEGFRELEERGHRRNNPQAVERIAALLTAFRSMSAPVIHVRHASDEPGSVLRPDRPGYAPMPPAREADGELVVIKRVNSAFIGTDLAARLRGMGSPRPVIVGGTTNHCVETTVRMAGNLGFRPILVRDAAWTFDRVGVDGEIHAADDIHRMTLANLSGEFADILTTREAIERLRDAAEGG